MASAIVSPFVASAQQSPNPQPPTLNVYGNAGSLLVSDEYVVRIRLRNSPDWIRANPLQTKVPVPPPGQDLKYYENLWGWSHSYVNFEMNSPVNVEVSKKNNQPISSATKVYPESKVKDLEVSRGRLYFTLEKPANVAVDIDGLMASRDTTIRSAKAIHNLSIHANPILSAKPLPTDPDVYAIDPLSPLSSYIAFADSGKRVLYFKPGAHDLGEDFKVYPGKQYYIPGDAIVYGTFNNTKPGGDGNYTSLTNNSVRFFGHGTISGQKIGHWDLPEFGETHEIRGSLSWKKNPLRVWGMQDVSVEGLTIADPANNSMILAASNTADVLWAKILTWRVNGDGVQAFEQTRLEDSFIRTQDDGNYVNGLGNTISNTPASTKNLVMWSDSNGGNMRLSGLPNFAFPSPNKLRIDSIDVIFRRNLGFSGSAGLELPESDPGDRGQGVIFSNLHFSDRIASQAAIKIHQNTGTFSGTLFEHVTIANGNLKNELVTSNGGVISDLTFHNLVMGGSLVTLKNWTDFFAVSGNVAQPTFTSGLYSRNGWKASASKNASSATQGPAQAIDGNLATSWTTGERQTAGGSQWFQVDMLSPRTFDQIQIDHGSSVNDYPRGYQVHVSNDGVTWGNAVAVGTLSSSTSSLAISINPVPKARYVRIYQTGNADNSWSIHELNVRAAQGTTPIEYARNGWTGTYYDGQKASAMGYEVFDNDPQSGWQSYAYQSSGMTVTVNMSEPKSIGKIVVDSGRFKGDHPRQYEVYVSTDGSVWSGPVASGYGTGGLLAINLQAPVTGQYIQVRQLGSSTSNWWSIAEFRVFDRW